MENKTDIIVESDIVKDKALKLVKEVLENSIENIILDRKVSTSPCLDSISEEAPEEPVEAPEEPVEAPEEPVEAPEEPVEAPEEPVEAPEELDVINLEMEEVLVEISVEPDNEITLDEIVGEKYCCSLWRW